MAKQISQETFDAAMKENIDEFEMEAEEALNDAVQQFEAQVSRLFTHNELKGQGYHWRFLCRARRACLSVQLLHQVCLCASDLEDPPSFSHLFVK